MKRILFVLLFGLITAVGYSQKNDTNINMELGKGLNISMDDGKQNIKIGGYIQLDGVYNEVKGMPSQQRFGVRRAYLDFGGRFYNDKLSFFTQFDFSDAYPLLDAWVGYHPFKFLTIAAGQKQAFSGPISMTFEDNALVLGDRSLAFNTFFTSGRELGVFLMSRLPINSFGADLGVAVTSGDGRNSFGSSSIDYDLGGFKYTGRATVYPLGYFSKGNELTDTDFAREKSVKLSVGGTYSYNVGVSDKIGEGHGNFNLYDADGNPAFPDYQKISADVMLKYNGFTVLGEFINATGANLNGLYTRPQPNAQLLPRQIADYLVLGNGFNFQAGYFFRNSWAVDLRYSTIVPEWKDNISLIAETRSYTTGIAKYFTDNRLKLQLAVSYIDYRQATVNNRRFIGEIIAHVVF